MAQGGEQRFVETFIAQSAIEAFAERILLRLAGSDVVPGDAALLRPAQDGRRGQRGPLSLTIQCGRPRAAITASNSRATRAPDNDVSATKPRASRPNWPTIARMRKHPLIQQALRAGPTALYRPPLNDLDYNMKLGYVALTAALAAGIATVGAGRAHAVGCLSGAAAGAVAGHYAGHHAVLGAIGGCVAGHEIAKHRENKERLQETHAQQQTDYMSK